MSGSGDWIQTYTGKQFFVFEPRIEDIDIADIAHALSLQCRFSGHCNTHYSVAEHSWRVSVRCTSSLWGLLHDASEAYLVDLPRPLKNNGDLGRAYKELEAKVMAAVCERFGLPKEMPADVKEADDFLVYWEKRDIMGPEPAAWSGGQGLVLPQQKINPVPARDAELAFISRFQQLYKGD